ncbi:MAG: hypothetical protein IPP90_15755 [Gemmatimonadaceae bacterium]|nr:hypothetical protein [Gemmatimonadaceae bacterium]
MLASPIVRTIYIRRSVAAGEAVFPLSDLDLAMVIDPASGVEIETLRRRYRLARLAFPRLGECQLFTQADLDEFAVTDPYRASLDRRFAVTVYGPPPAIPARPIPPLETARRLVFWFEHFIPTAIRQGNRRNLRKFALEMANALGVLEGRWGEPLRSRRETSQRMDPRRTDARNGSLLADCCEYAARAQALVRPPAPWLSHVLELPGLQVVPSIDAIRTTSRAEAMTVEVLDLLLHTQSPWLWRTHGSALEAAGFQVPSPLTWVAAARRYAGGERVRGPGFLESGTHSVVARLKAAADILGGERPDLPPDGTSAPVFYLDYYDALVAWAARLRSRVPSVSAPRAAIPFLEST